MTNSKYVWQLKIFKEHMLDAFDAFMGTDSDDEMNDFYDSEFTITFRGKTVILGNSAEVFQAIETLINNEIDEWEE